MRKIRCPLSAIVIGVLIAVTGIVMAPFSAIAENTLSKWRVGHPVIGPEAYIDSISPKGVILLLGGCKIKNSLYEMTLIVSTADNAQSRLKMAYGYAENKQVRDLNLCLNEECRLISWDSSDYGRGWMTELKISTVTASNLNSVILENPKVKDSKTMIHFTDFGLTLPTICK